MSEDGVDVFAGYGVHPVAAIFPLIGDKELQTLADDIKANGLREPIHIGLLSDESGEYRVIDGRNRYRACLLAGVKPSIARNQMDPDKIAPWIISHNLHRRHLTTSQKAAVAVAYEPALAELAAQRMKAGVKADPVPNSEQGETGRAAEQAAALVGVGKSSVLDAKYVARHDPDMFEQIKKGELTASGAAKALRSAKTPRRPLDSDIRRLAVDLVKVTAALERLAKDDRLPRHDDLYRGLIASQLDTISERHARVTKAAVEDTDWNDETQEDSWPSTFASYESYTAVLTSGVRGEHKQQLLKYLQSVVKEMESG